MVLSPHCRPLNRRSLANLSAIHALSSGHWLFYASWNRIKEIRSCLFPCDSLLYTSFIFFFFIFILSLHNFFVEIHVPVWQGYSTARLQITHMNQQTQFVYGFNSHNTAYHIMILIYRYSTLISLVGHVYKCIWNVATHSEQMWNSICTAYQI